MCGAGAYEAYLEYSKVFFDVADILKSNRVRALVRKESQRWQGVTVRIGLGIAASPFSTTMTPTGRSY